MRIFNQCFASIVFFFLFIKEFVYSNLTVASIILFTPRDKIDAKFVSYDYRHLTRGEMLFIAHLITLTPGTVVANINEGEQRLVIHVLRRDEAHVPAAAIEEVLRCWIDSRLVQPLQRITRC